MNQSTNKDGLERHLPLSFPLSVLSCFFSQLWVGNTEAVEAVAAVEAVEAAGVRVVVSVEETIATT